MPMGHNSVGVVGGEFWDDPLEAGIYASQDCLCTPCLRALLRRLTGLSSLGDGTSPWTWRDRIDVGSRTQWKLVTATVSDMHH